jgi:hypothetical protein
MSMPPLKKAPSSITLEEFEQASEPTGSDGADGSGGKPNAGLPPLLPQALEIPPGFRHTQGSATTYRKNKNEKR